MKRVLFIKKANGFTEIRVGNMFCGELEDVGDLTPVIMAFSNVFVRLELEQILLEEVDYLGQVTFAILTR